ncbi:MAG: hypothetical protein AcusKO_41950 [Acuticoccus sp.]
MARAAHPAAGASLGIALVLFAAAAGPARAQDTGGAEDTGDGRFQMERIGEDVLRLDRESGQVELCVSTATDTPTFACRVVIPATQTTNPPPAAAASEPASLASGALQAENRTLRQENARLRRRLSMIAALVKDAEDETKAAGPDTVPLLPPAARREIDQAIDVTGYALSRFRDMVDSLIEENTGN